MKNLNFIAHDGIELKGFLFEVKNAKGVIQIIHGMCEHSKRYFDVIKLFNDAGYSVYISDLRAHGETAKSVDTLGYDADIYNNTIEDQILISQELVKLFPNTPLYIFGHSFGSMVTQGYIQKCNLSKKIVLCGTTDCNNMAFKMGSILAKMLQKKNGAHSSAGIIEKMSFASYAKKFENGNWLTRDEEIYKKYVDDPYSGTPFPISFYVSLFSNTTKLNKSMNNIARDTKLMLITGGNDAFNSNGKLSQRLSKKYAKNGLDVTFKSYPNARHELLNELNKEEVVADVIAFYEK